MGCFLGKHCQRERPRDFLPLGRRRGVEACIRAARRRRGRRSNWGDLRRRERSVYRRRHFAGTGVVSLSWRNVDRGRSHRCWLHSYGVRCRGGRFCRGRGRGRGLGRYWLWCCGGHDYLRGWRSGWCDDRFGRRAGGGFRGGRVLRICRGNRPESDSPSEQDSGGPQCCRLEFHTLRLTDGSDN